MVLSFKTSDLLRKGTVTVTVLFFRPRGGVALCIYGAQGEYGRIPRVSGSIIFYHQATKIDIELFRRSHWQRSNYLTAKRVFYHYHSMTIFVIGVEAYSYR